jgi:hypothetical protein
VDNTDFYSNQICEENMSVKFGSIKTIQGKKRNTYCVQIRIKGYPHISPQLSKNRGQILVKGNILCDEYWPAVRDESDALKPFDTLAETIDYVFNM